MVNIACYSDIPGWGNFSQVYKQLVSDLPDNCDILEVGSGFGRSTWSMLDAMTNDMNLYILDSFEMDTVDLWLNFLDVGSPTTINNEDILNFKDMCYSCSQKEIFLHVIKQHPRYKQIKEIYTIPSEAYVFLDMKNQFDLIFLDGDHSYEALKRELKYFKNCSSISGHDYGNPAWPGVEKAVTEFIDQNKDRKLKIFKEDEIFLIKK